MTTKPYFDIILYGDNSTSKGSKIMNTPLEELIEKLTVECNFIGTEKISGITALRFIKEISEPFLQKESLRTQEIAIGFSIWTEKNGWDWSGNHQVFINDNFEPKEGSELFKDYMETLKP